MKIAKYVHTTRWNYRQLRMQYDLGSNEFRLKVEICVLLAGAMGVMLIFMAGYSTSGYVHGF